MGLRAGVYGRQSRNNEKSISEQIEECASDALREGMTVTATYSDGESASRHARRKRSDWPRVLSDVDSGLLDVVCLWESSRGDRDLTEWSKFLDLCRNRSVLIRVKTHQRTYDLTNLRDWKTLAEDGVDSAYESEKTRERVLRSMARSAKDGRPHGKLLFGYAREYEPTKNGPKLVAQIVREDQASIIREAAERVASGEALYSVAQDFNNRGITGPRGGTWIPTQVKRLVTNVAYLGKREYQGQHFDAMWPAILDAKTFNDCQAIVSDPDRLTSRGTPIQHLLSGIARCGECGDRLRIIMNRGISSYICHGKFHVAYKEARLDAYVEGKVKERLYRLDVTELDNPEQEADRLAAKQEAAELRAYLTEFTKSAVSKRLSPQRLIEVEAELAPQIAAAEARARAIHLPRVVGKVVKNPSLWDSSTVAEKRDIMRSLITIEVHRIGRGRKAYQDSERVVIKDATTGKIID